MSMSESMSMSLSMSMIEYEYENVNVRYLMMTYRDLYPCSSLPLPWTLDHLWNRAHSNNHSKKLNNAHQLTISNAIQIISIKVTLHAIKFHVIKSSKN
jgi:hypothetical protein